MMVVMIIGVYSFFIFREEPQIIVPMADVMVGYPGASPTESRVAKPLRKSSQILKG
jgi:multidrug efflux pump subunit AcrB